MTQWTISRVAAWTARDLAGRGIESSRLDAELLVAHALGLRRIDLYLRHDQPMTDAELARVRALVERRRRFEPVAYILGEREFYGRKFLVDRRVLVPRPETEGVVEAALAALPPSTPCVALDVGAGSGALAVTLACERGDVTVDAVELSEGAAEVARENARRLGAEGRVTVLQGSLYKPVSGKTYHLIVSNPPYIPTEEVDRLMPDVSEHEPRLALDGGPDGEMVLRPLVLGARAHLVPGGALVVELGHDQADRARALAEEGGLVDVKVLRDLARIERVLVARAPEGERP